MVVGTQPRGAEDGTGKGVTLGLEGESEAGGYGGCRGGQVQGGGGTYCMSLG